MTAREARVAPGTTRDTGCNTLVVTTVGVVIPLEADVDDDPSTKDAIRVRSEVGDYMAELNADDDAVEQDGDTPLYRYRFRAVPRGVYTVEVRFGDRWHPVVHGLRIGPDGARVGKQPFEGELRGALLGRPDDASVIEDAVENDDDEPGCPG